MALVYDPNDNQRTEEIGQNIPGTFSRQGLNRLTSDDEWPRRLNYDGINVPVYGVINENEEQYRQDSEATRQAQEAARVSNESQRVENELARQQGYQQMIENIDEQIINARSAGNKTEDAVYVTTAVTTSIPIPFDNFQQLFDMLFVDVNGLDLAEGDDYQIIGNTIELVTPIPAGQEIHFRTLSYQLADADKNIHVENYYENYIANGGCVRAFDTVADMQSATLEAGDICHTNGFHTAGDGGAAFYKITATGTANGMDILACGDVFANLVITEPYVTPEMFGAWGDGVTDDVQYIRRAIEYVSTTYSSSSSTWIKSGCVKLMPKSYLIDSSFIDSTFPVAASQIALKGSGKRSYLVAGSNCSVMIDNQNKIGFSYFDEITFVGNDTTFLFTTGANPQSLNFNRCNFSNFHTILDINGTVDNSEGVFTECKISNCGSDDSNCDLFVFNNQQAVNWRFYATDIESFYGVCFHFKKGTSIQYYQGSIIPVNGLVFSYDGADYNSFGAGNLPTAVMCGVRYELRGSSRLIYASFNGTVTIQHYSCGMGGYNASTNYKHIDLTNCLTQLTFDNCTNFLNYKLYWNFTRYPVVPANGQYIAFSNTSYSDITDMIGRSTFDASGSYKKFIPPVFFNGQNINEITNEGLMQAGTFYRRTATAVTDYLSGSNTDGWKTQLPRSGFVTSITLESSYTTGFGANTDLIAELYNASDTLIGSATIKPASRSKSVIQVNAAVTTDWYVLLKNTYGSSGNLYIPHILYAEYLS